jgi:hypothetical protein
VSTDRESPWRRPARSDETPALHRPLPSCRRRPRQETGPAARAHRGGRAAGGAMRRAGGDRGLPAVRRGGVDPRGEPDLPGRRGNAADGGRAGAGAGDARAGGPLLRGDRENARAVAGAGRVPAGSPARAVLPDQPDEVLPRQGDGGQGGPGALGQGDRLVPGPPGPGDRAGAAGGGRLTGAAGGERPSTCDAGAAAGRDRRAGVAGGARRARLRAGAAAAPLWGLALAERRGEPGASRSRIGGTGAAHAGLGGSD